MIPRTKGIQLSLTRFSARTNRMSAMQKPNSSMQSKMEALSVGRLKLIRHGQQLLSRGQVFLREARFESYRQV
jgi:hypothetical protein